MDALCFKLRQSNLSTLFYFSCEIAVLGLVDVPYMNKIFLNSPPISCVMSIKGVV